MGGDLQSVQDGPGILGVHGYSEGIVMGGHPQIVWDGLGILGVYRYSDRGDSHGWTSSDRLGWSGYPWCTQILRHRVLV